MNTNSRTLKMSVEKDHLILTEQTEHRTHCIALTLTELKKALHVLRCAQAARLREAVVKRPGVMFWYGTFLIVSASLTYTVPPAWLAVPMGSTGACIGLYFIICAAIEDSK